MLLRVGRMLSFFLPAPYQLPSGKQGIMLERPGYYGALEEARENNRALTPIFGFQSTMDW
jgi:hypothetical protein